jgi:hypothetical protein
VTEKTPNIKSDEVSLKELILDIKRLWQFLWSKWKVILIAGLMGGAIGLTISFLTRPRYIAMLSFVVENEKSSPLGSYSGLASMVGIDLGGGESMFSSDNIIELMKSRKMIEGALLSAVLIDGKNTTLLEHYLNFSEIREGWSKEPSLTNIHFLPGCNPSGFSRTEDSIVGVVYKDLVENVISISKPNKKLSMIVSTCKTTNELFSKEFLEELNNNVSEFYIETKTKRLKQNVDILQSRSDSLAGIITSATYGIANLTDQNLSSSRAIVMAGRTRKQVDLQVTGAAYGEVIKNLEISKVTLQKETPLIQVIDSPIYPLKKEKIGKLKGLVFGGFLAGFLTVGWLLIRRFYFSLMSQ